MERLWLKMLVVEIPMEAHVPSRGVCTFTPAGRFPALQENGTGSRAELAAQTE